MMKMSAELTELTTEKDSMCGQSDQSMISLLFALCQSMSFAFAFASEHNYTNE